MEYQSISIQVPADVAKAYEKASDEKRRIAAEFFSSFIKPVPRKEAARRFARARAKVAKQAKQSGLTPEILEEILAEKE